MYEPVLSGSYSNMGGTGTPAIPDSNSLNYSAASSTALQEHKMLFAEQMNVVYSRTPAQRNTYSTSGKGKGIAETSADLYAKVFLSLTDRRIKNAHCRERQHYFDQCGLGDTSIQFKTDASSVGCH